MFFYEYFSFSLTWDRMGAQNATPPINRILNPLKLFLNFLMSCPHKSTILRF